MSEDKEIMQKRMVDDFKFFIDDYLKMRREKYHKICEDTGIDII